MQYRDYQEELDSNIHYEWSNGNRNVIAVSPTGTGKTVLFSGIIKKEKHASIVIAHRNSLVLQISRALNRNEVPHRLIAQPGVIREAVNLHMAETGKSHYDPSANCGVSSLKTLLSRKDSLRNWFAQIRLWVTDECFPGDVLVDGRRIDEIRVGDVVTSFDEVTGLFSQQKVSFVFKNPSPSIMLKITTENNQVMCTSNHPFYTQRGWVNAQDLTQRDWLYILRKANSDNDRGSEVRMAQDRSNLLHERLCMEVSSDSWKKTPTCNNSRHSLLCLFKTKRSHRSITNPLCKNRSSILFSSLCKRISSANFLANNGEHQQEIRFFTNEIKKPNVRRKNQGEDGEHITINKSPTVCARRQWSPTDKRGKHACKNTRSIWVRAINYSKHRIIWERLPTTLQTGLCKPSFKNCYRSGWGFSSQSIKKRSGHEKRPLFNWQRVESVSIQKRGDPEFPLSDFIYNLEVENNATYLANGIVVHNCHHLTEGNSWGTAVALLPNARGLGVTATPVRADGLGLGVSSNGVFNTLVEGRSLRDMIVDGWLVNYQLYAPASDVDFTGLKPTASGDYSAQKLRTVEAKSHIVGDVVQHYLRLAKGKLGVTFASNLETAREITDDFNRNGIPARLVQAETPEVERFQIERLFKKRELLQLVNVDLFGEGYDLPELEVVSLARKTESFSLFVQQCGRVLRPSFKPGLPLDTVEQRKAAIQQSNKPVGIIIDHVNNIRRHGRPRYCERTGELFIDLCHAQWSLDSTKNKTKRDPDLIPTTTCAFCSGEYPGVSRVCPYCGQEHLPIARSKPEHVNGDLELLTPEALAELVGVVENANKSPVEVMQDYLHKGFGNVIAKSQAINQNRRLEILKTIGCSIDIFAGFHRVRGRTDSEINRLFYFRFGTDVLSARSLGIPEATKLRDELQDWIENNNIITST